MEDADQLPEVYDCQWRLPSIFFFWVALPQNEVVETWHLIICLLAIHSTIDNALTSYSLLPPASNSSSFSGSSGALLSTRPFILVSCSNSDMWNISCIFQFVGSSSWYACFFTIWGLGKVQRTCCRASCSSLSWCICYSARLSLPERSYSFLLPCHGLFSVASVCEEGSDGKLPSAFSVFVPTC